MEVLDATKPGSYRVIFVLEGPAPAMLSQLVGFDYKGEAEAAIAAFKFNIPAYMEGHVVRLYER